MQPAHHTQASSFTLWAVLSLIALVPIIYCETLRDYTLTPKLLLFQTILVFIFIFWLASSPRTLLLPAIGLPALCYLIINATSIIYATDQVSGLLQMTKILSGFLLFFALSNRLLSHQIPMVLRTGAITGIAISLIGINEYLGWYPLNIPSAGLPSSTLGFRNLAAMYLIQNIPLSLALFATDRSKIWTWIAAIATALMIVFLIYTRTRGAWIGLLGSAFTVTLILLTTNRSKLNFSFLKSKRVPFIFNLVLTLTLSSLPLGLQKIGPQSIDEKKTDLGTALTSIVQSKGDRGRLNMWKYTLKMIADRPLLGFGIGNWEVYYPRYDHGDRVTFYGTPRRPHNDFLWILSELGIVGFLCYLWLGLAIVKVTWIHLRSPNNSNICIAVACLASLLAITFHSLFSFPRERIPPTLYFWLSLGLISILDRSRSQSLIGTIPTRITVSLSLCLTIVQLAFTGRLIDFATHMHRAIQAEKKNNWQEVASETGTAIRAGAFHSEAVHLRGYALNSLKRFSESRKLYTSALKLRPHDIQMLNGLAIAEQNLGSFNEARDYYLRALDLVPNLSDIRYNLAGLYLITNRPDSSALEYKTVLDQEGDSPDLLHRFAAASALSGKSDKAIETFRRAFQLPIAAKVHFQLSEQLYQQHHRLEALQLFYQTFLQFWKGDPRYKEYTRIRIAELMSDNSK